MKTPIPSGNWTLLPRDKAPDAVALPPPVFEKFRSPIGYKPDPRLVAAVNVSLLLGQPLLVTGEPGCGKTSLAGWIAHQLGLGEPEAQAVKSTTSGRDLLYSFDELGRFRDAQPGGRSRPLTDYLELSALGRAILFSGGPEKALLGEGVQSREADQAFPPPRRHGDLEDNFPDQRRRVVLIDELDKAPRDTPNDLLTEIEAMRFAIPELGLMVEGDPACRPIVVITSNSEKSLPEAFLRRCVYFDIPPADADARREIVAARNPALAARKALLGQALDLFAALIDPLSRKPGMAELLAWLETLAHLLPANATSIGADKALLISSMSALAKNDGDLAAARNIAREWP